MQEPAASAESSSKTANLDSAVELPQCFHVRYLGFRSAQGLWGIKYTRNPVDDMVANVKACQEKLHLMKFFVKKNGCKLESVYNGNIETR